MEGAETFMDEVVVVAYGEQKKISLTGAISSVATRELRQSPVANLSNALAGRLPGLVAFQPSGEPGNDLSQLFIRGVSRSEERRGGKVCVSTCRFRWSPIH